jgi:hypothetical protein
LQHGQNLTVVLEDRQVAARYVEELGAAVPGAMLAVANCTIRGSAPA